MNIIKNHDMAKPLFLYVASLAPHAPYQAPKQDIDAYKNAGGDEHRHTITDLDTQVGRIVAALKQKNMLDNTLRARPQINESHLIHVGIVDARGISNGGPLT